MPQPKPKKEDYTVIVPTTPGKPIREIKWWEMPQTGKK